ncbi:MAG: glycosyltransferase family 4 protein [Chloroflexi bacterium]|nr:glycosyltransferase family 4 protein [Chloroflexota bacterium]
MPTRIGIDFTSAALEHAGIGRYARELVRGLARLDHATPYVLFVPRDARPDLLEYDWPPNFALRRAALSERTLAALWHRARVPLPVEVFVGSVDVFYSPDFLLPPTRARKRVVTVHDLSYVRVPECFPAPLLNYLNQAVPRSLRRANLILADAASTQRDLIDVYGVSRTRICVLYSGVDPRFSPRTSPAAQTHVRELTGGKPYVLTVSTIQPRKNNVRLIEAFARLVAGDEPAAAGPARYQDLRLVICGGKGWMYDQVFQAVDRLGLRERVIFPEFVRDDYLPALYAEAAVFVYPSLYEGFGLPVAEAMACGTPVVTSNASSLPEVAGDAALYFDPRDVAGMAAALERALGDDALRDDLRARGFAQVKQFSWDRAARELRGHLFG